MAVNHPISRSTSLCVSLAGRPSNLGTRFHNFLYQALDLDFVYKAFAPVDLAAAVQGIRGLPIRGAAVSMPFKEQVIPLLDELDETASVIESVNTIVNTDGVLRGYNTDYAAVRGLFASAGVGPAWSAAVFGSGGMAKAVVAALTDLGVVEGTVIGRNEATREGLARRSGWSHAAAATPGARLLVNATPIGMSGGAEADSLPCGEDVVSAAELVMDVVAVPAQTPLLGLAVALGKVVLRGVDVMTLQAVEQFVLYTGVRPAPELVSAAQAWSRAEQ